MKHPNETMVVVDLFIWVLWEIPSRWYPPQCCWDGIWRACCCHKSREWWVAVTRNWRNLFEENPSDELGPHASRILIGIVGETQSPGRATTSDIGQKKKVPYEQGRIKGNFCWWVNHFVLGLRPTVGKVGTTRGKISKKALTLVIGSLPRDFPAILLNPKLISWVDDTPNNGP